MSFSDNLKRIRKEKSISQEDLAEMLDVSRQAVSKWEQGIGYPEMEKLLLLSQKLNISLDYLMLGETVPFATNPSADPARINISSGTIAIKSYDGKSIANYYKVLLSHVYFKAKADEPAYVLIGVSSGSFWGERSALLGWYAREKDIQQEISEIYDAIKNGSPSYELKYAVNVKTKLLRVKIDNGNK